MTRLVNWRGGPEHPAGRNIRLPDDEAAAAIARGEGVPMQPIRFLVSHVAPYRLDEVATFTQQVADRLIGLGLAEPEPLDDAPAPAGESKGLDHPPEDRMIHRAPITKGVQP